MKRADVVLIGAGQAGLSASYHLLRKGVDFVVLDANPRPGGAWQHRWDSLTLGATHRVHDLPGLPLGEADPTRPASEVVADYYARFETEYDVPVLRPVHVDRVTSNGELLHVETDRGTWAARTLLNATGTWDKPHWPYYPGRERFRGRQLHTHDFVSAEDLAGQHVVVVGGGTSAVQFLLQLAPVASTTWVTRRPVEFVDRSFGPEWGREVERRVAERVRQGLPAGSVISNTGLGLTPAYQAGIDAGVLVARPMFASIEEDGVRWADGTFQRADVILWATGFRAALDHLAPLHLREPGGGIRVEGTTVVRDPRVQLVGYGPSASTLGATRAGRQAALAATRYLQDRAAA